MAVPDEAHEALRDLVRTREAANKDLSRARAIGFRSSSSARATAARCARRPGGVKYLAPLRGLNPCDVAVIAVVCSDAKCRRYHVADVETKLAIAARSMAREGQA